MVTGKRFAALSGFSSSINGAIMLAALLLGLCSGAPTPAIAQQAAASECTVSVEQAWLDDMVASAYVSGACDAATIDLVVRNGVDEVIWSASYASGDLFGFGEVVDVDTMQMALSDWLGDYVEISSSAGLPKWPQGADMPDAGEFPFYVEEGVSRSDYEQLRAADYPMICYIQGGESTLCLVRQPGVNALTSVGAQSFPG
jgi:hypothetical protein